MRRLLIAAMYVLVLAARPAMAVHETCGDHDGSGTIAATDALLLLSSAVGQPVSLQCPACPTTVTTTTIQANEEICGDDDRSGAVAASDALLVLAKAVGQDVTLYCPGCFGELTVEAESSGFYDQTGRHTAGNYAVGWYGPPNDDELRDYFVFDLPPITGTITSATLRLTTAPPSFVRYGSDDPSETYALFEIVAPLDALTDGTAGASAWDDLADGPSYGELVATSAIGETVDVVLNATGIAALTASGGRFALAGAITTLTRGGTNEFLFNSTSAILTRQLIVVVE